MEINEKIKDITNALFARYGPILGGSDLYLCLGYKTGASFSRAHRLGLIELQIFEIPSRRGKFALTNDVAVWVAKVSSPLVEESKMPADEQRIEFTTDGRSGF